MTATNPTLKHSLSQTFSEAEETWNLEQLYSDLSTAKQRYRASNRQRLTRTEKTHLRGLLCGYSPAEIAAELHRDCGGLRVDWSRGLYRYIETLTDQPLKEWRNIVRLLAEYRCHTHVAVSQPTIPTTPSAKIDCCEAVDASVFYGRETELATLKQWVVEDRCRVVAVRGMVGIGKTKLVSKLIPSLETEFDFIIWRNLSHQPPLIHVLADLIQFLSDQPNNKPKVSRFMSQSIKQLLRSKIPLREGSLINFLDKNPLFSNSEMQAVLIAEGMRELIQCLQQRRCLIILDGWEALFQPQMLVGNYRTGYQGYGKLLKQVGKFNHQSCLILTTREVPKTVTYLSGVSSPVRTLTLGGLGESAEKLLKKRGLLEPAQYPALIQQYNGNPQALQIVAKTIHNIFGSRGADFLAVNPHPFLGDFSVFLGQQLNRLSTLEQQILSILAARENPVSIWDLKENLKVYKIAELMKAIESLEVRSLIKIIQKNQTLVQIDPLVSHYLISSSDIQSKLGRSKS